MSISNLKLSEYTQNFNISDINKTNNGEVNTPFYFIEKMLNLLPAALFENKYLKWMDTGAGCGYFSIFLYNKLNISLQYQIPNPKKRSKHIITNMLYIVEINSNNIQTLRHIFGSKANIYHGNYLEMQNLINSDIIIGNPPFNSSGKIKVPTNTQLNKKNDGSAIWKDFVKKSISLLKPEGYLCYIVPSIWMKPDKAKMYDFLTQFKITKLHTMTNTETNQLFSGQAATPTCYFVLQNKKTDGIIELYDKDKKDYINFSLKPNIPIPVFGVHIINKILPFTEKVGDLKVIKITKPADYIDSSVVISKISTQNCPFPNIKTCKLTKNVAQLEIKSDGMTKAF